MKRIEPGLPEGAPIEIAMVVSRYNEWITDRLREGAIETLDRLAGERARVTEIPAPGTFELPVLAAAAAETHRFHAIICLGCVIRGETEHDRHIARAVAHALADLSTGSDARRPLPVAFGIITADNAEQAEARAGGPKGNKGAEAMEAALLSLGIIHRLRFDDAERTR